MIGTLSGCSVINYAKRFKQSITKGFIIIIIITISVISCHFTDELLFWIYIFEYCIACVIDYVIYWYIFFNKKRKLIYIFFIKQRYQPKLKEFTLKIRIWKWLLFLMRFKLTNAFSVISIELLFKLIYGSKANVNRVLLKYILLLQQKMNPINYTFSLNFFKKYLKRFLRNKVNAPRNNQIIK